MKKLLLAIESSCDDSAIAVIDINSYECLFHMKISQEKEHAKYYGVVPELAARLHARALPDILAKARPFFKELVCVAATCTPGLSVSLLSGISMAKTLAMALKLPLIGVNHLVGHIYSLFIDKKASYNIHILLVSGGHTMLLKLLKDDILIYSKSLDDSFGESFDKVAKMLGMEYPGGEKIQALALKAKQKKLSFSLPLRSSKSLDFSFSGLKNQVRLKTLKNLSEDEKAEIAYAFEQCASDHIINKLKRLFKKEKVEHLGIVGGAAANLCLRFKLKNLCEQNSCKLSLAPLKYCSDNALMIARAAISQYEKKDFFDIKDEMLFKNNL